MGNIGGLLLLGIFTGPGDETMLVLTLGLGVAMVSTISGGMGVLTGELCGSVVVLCGPMFVLPGPVVVLPGPVLVLPGPVVVLPGPVVVRLEL